MPGSPSTVKYPQENFSGFIVFVAERSIIFGRLFIFGFFAFFLRLLVKSFHFFFIMLQASSLQLEKFTVRIQFDHLKPSYEST